MVRYFEKKSFEKDSTHFLLENYSISSDKKYEGKSVELKIWICFSEKKEEEEIRSK